MPLLEDVAKRVAERTLTLMEETGDDDLEKKVAEQIGASSPTLQEAFSTALRILKAEARATRFIDEIDGTAAKKPKPKPRVVAPEPEIKEDEQVEEPIILGDARKQITEEDIEELIALPGPSTT